MQTDTEPLMSLPWPGNIRELQNAVERAVITGKGQLLDFDFLSQPARAKDTATDMIKPKIDQVIHELQWRQWQRENIILALEPANWKIQGKNSASQYLGIKPTTLRSRMERLGIKK
jgi:transcriptional regulator with GAF, ATPase, and Fis domain